MTFLFPLVAKHPPAVPTECLVRSCVLAGEAIVDVVVIAVDFVSEYNFMK